MFKLFAKYTSVGLVNTIMHWAVFGLCFLVYQTNQSTANFLGFMVAVTFSYFANAKFTFNAQKSKTRYFLYVVFMGSLSIIVGALSDEIKLPAVVTLVIFSVVSLLIGFLYSKFFIFKGTK
jgi:putative flippase GtrA